MLEAVVTCPAGLENACAEDLRSQGNWQVKELRSAVLVSADDSFLYEKLTFASRVGLRVLKPLFEVRNATKDNLYQAAKSFRWDQLMNENSSFSISAHGHNEYLTNSNYTSLIIKDGLCDYFREFRGKRPNVNKESPQITLDVSVHNKSCKISLDYGGRSLHMRGYRKEGGIAPIMENMAYALLKVAKYEPSIPLYDLMGGSGTFSIEAALDAHGLLPGDCSDNFAFKQWPQFNAMAYNDAISKLIRSQQPSAKIFYNDSSKSQKHLAEMNSKRANVYDKILFSQSDVLDFKPQSETGLIIINPPYNERLDFEADMTGKDFFKNLGQQLKTHFSGFKFAVITANDADCKELNMSPFKRIKVMNGKIPCHFMIFDIR